MSTEAVVVVDVQNAFCHPDGSFARMGHDMSACQAAVPGSVRLVEEARAHGVPVYFVVYGYAPDYADGGYLVENMHPEVREHQAMLAGTWDAEVVDELAPRDDEPVIVKNRYSAFINTDLEDRLRSRGITSVVLCGVTTNVCVESSARDAAQRDFGVTVVADACGEIKESRHTASLAVIRHGFGQVRTVDEVAGTWSAAAAPSTSEATA